MSVAVSPRAPDASRLTLFDLAKGLAIILVVYGHGLRGLVDAGLVAPYSPLRVSDYFIYTFHMPVFFVVSGWLFNAQDKPAAPFWRSRLLTIVYPYFLWSILQLGAQLLLAGSGAVNHHFDLDRMLMIGWWPVAPFWFLYALFFCHLLGFYLWRVRPEWLVAGGAVLLWLSTMRPSGELGDISYGFTYFAVGMLARARDWQRRVPQGWATATGLSLVYLIVAWACYRAGVAERLAFPAALLGVAATITWSASISRFDCHAPVDLLSGIGRFSMGIYVMHIFFLAGIRTIMVRLVHVSEPLAILLVAVPLSVIIPAAVQAVLVRWKVNDWVGLPFSANRRAPAARATPPAESPIG